MRPSQPAARPAPVMAAGCCPRPAALSPWGRDPAAGLLRREEARAGWAGLPFPAPREVGASPPARVPPGSRASLHPAASAPARLLASVTHDRASRASAGCPEPGTPGAVPGPASRVATSLSPWDPPPRGLLHVRSGPDPRPAALGSGCGARWVVPGPSSDIIPEPSATRKARVSYWPVAVASAVVSVCSFFGFVLPFFFLFF